MTDKEAEVSTRSHSRRRQLVLGRRSRLRVALLGLATAGVLALTLATGSAGAQSGDSNGVTARLHAEDGHAPLRDHHDEAARAHHEGESRDHHDEVIWVHHEDESRDGHGDCDHHGGKRLKHAHRAAVNAVAELLGTDPEALRDQLKDGETLAGIAAAQGVEVSDVIDAVVTAISEHAAEHGYEVDTEALTEKVTALVNGEHPYGKDGSQNRRGLRRWGGQLGSNSAVSAV